VTPFASGAVAAVYQPVGPATWWTAHDHPITNAEFLFVEEGSAIRDLLSHFTHVQKSGDGFTAALPMTTRATPVHRHR